MAPFKNHISFKQLPSRTTFLFSSLLFSFSILLYLFSLTSHPLQAINTSTLTPQHHLFSVSSLTSFNIELHNITSAVVAAAAAAIASPVSPIHSPLKENGRLNSVEDTTSCDIFDGYWVLEDHDPIYAPGSCPYLDDAFNCFNNGRPDFHYLRYRWKPFRCQIPRFDGMKMLKKLRGKKMVFVGDSLNRNMWQSLVCALRQSVKNKTSVFQVTGRRVFRTEGFYSFKFKDYNCTVEFIRSPFLVQQWKIPQGIQRRETLRLDMMQDSFSPYHDADILVFNTGHWWTNYKTNKGFNYFQEGEFVYSKLKVEDAYTKALRTWADWVDNHVDSSRTKVFFAGYSASHFRGGQWNSGGRCSGETHPITNETHLEPYPWKMRVLESVISEMKTPVSLLNITKMTSYRKDGHPSFYRQPVGQGRPAVVVQDCSHWCLPGIPDSWNELLYASLLITYHSYGSKNAH